MHIHLADQYLHGHSLIHRLDPRTKATIAVFFILTTSLAPMGAFWVYGLLLFFVLGNALLARVGLGYVIKRSFITIPFAMAALTLPFTMPGETLLTIPVFGGISLSLEGTVRFASILVKSWISVQMAILLVAVTAFPDLLWGLRALRIPGPLIGIVTFMYRYLFVLSDEVLRMTRARAARSASVSGRRGGGSLLWRGKVAGQMAGSLMLRSFERSERIYSAMIARGYRGEMRTLTRFQLNRADIVSLAGCTLFFILTLSAAHSLF